MDQVATDEEYTIQQREAIELEGTLKRQTYAEYPALHWAREHHLNTRREAMEFDDLHYLFELYKDIGTTPRMCVIKAVQMGLSELFIIQSHIEAGDYGMTVMYVLPKYELRNRFVNNRI